MIKEAERDIDSEEDFEVVLGPPVRTVSKDTDVFKMEFDEVRKLKGLDKNFVRKQDRKLKTTGYSGKNGAASKQVETDDILGYTYLDCVIPPHNMDYLAQLYEISPAHHAAVNAKVESVFGLGYQWVESPKIKAQKNNKRAASGLKAMEKMISDAIVFADDWLNNLNNIDTFEEILRKIGLDYETTGNAYLEIGRDVSGFVNYIGHIPSIYMRVRRLRDGFVQVFSNKAVFFRNFGDDNYVNNITDDPNPNEVIHFKKASPTNNYYGVPDIIAAKGALAGNEFATRYNLDFFENKAVPRQVIISRGRNPMSAASKQKLIEFLETGLRGKHHRTIFIPLGKIDECDLEFKSIEAEQQDMSFGDFRESNNKEIFMGHRVPESRTGVVDKSGGGLAAAREADKIFKESYTTPEQTIFEKKFNKVVAQVTDVLVFRLNELSLTDEETQAKIDESDVRMGIVVPDEVRTRRSMPPRPDGKGAEPWQPNSQQAADAKANATKTRERDAKRTTNTSDSGAGTRNSKGDGRKQE